MKFIPGTLQENICLTEKETSIQSYGQIVFRLGGTFGCSGHLWDRIGCPC